MFVAIRMLDYFGKTFIGVDKTSGLDVPRIITHTSACIYEHVTCVTPNIFQNWPITHFEHLKYLIVSPSIFQETIPRGLVMKHRSNVCFPFKRFKNGSSKFYCSSESLGSRDVLFAQAVRWTIYSCSVKPKCNGNSRWAAIYYTRLIITWASIDWVSWFVHRRECNGVVRGIRLSLAAALGQEPCAGMTGH